MKSRTMASENRGAIRDLQSIGIDVLEKLFDQTPDIAFFVKNRGGEYLVVNNSLINRHGLKSKADALGKRPADICEGDFGTLPTEQDQRVLTTGRPLIDYLEMQWFSPGSPVWCLTTKLPLRDEKGKVIGLIGFSRDLKAPLATEEIPVEFADAMAEFEKDLSVDFSPGVLAERSGLSHTRLARLTKKLFSLTPSQLLAKSRVTAASVLLKESQLSIVEISQRCGYSDQSAFCRAFRTVTGITPTEFRKGPAKSVLHIQASG